MSLKSTERGQGILITHRDFDIGPHHLLEEVTDVSVIPEGRTQGRPTSEETRKDLR